MKQKITLKLKMDCSKCRNKALKIASEVPGVSSVSIEGNEKDRVVVIGEDVDTVCLGRMLKKKFRCVIILTVEEVKPKPPAATDQKGGKDGGGKDGGKDGGKGGGKDSGKDGGKGGGKDGKEKPQSCTLCIVPVDPCCRCRSPKCRGQCEADACCKCQSYRCQGDCKPCSKCQSHKCHGQCDFRPPWRCQGQCPPWYPCPTCCVIKCPPPPPPPPPPCPTLCDHPCGYRVVYDSNPDGCSIQ